MRLGTARALPGLSSPHGRPKKQKHHNYINYTSRPEPLQTFVAVSRIAILTDDAHTKEIDHKQMQDTTQSFRRAQLFQSSQAKAWIIIRLITNADTSPRHGARPQTDTGDPQMTLLYG